MTSYTAHFRIAIPDFNQEPWHADLEASIRSIDTALYQAILIQNVANWLNSTVYAIGAIVIDSATGLMWTCAVANTSTVSPTTFAQERVAHPTYWNATANIPQQRGAWVTATSYIPGDFVVDTNRYAVCLVSHVSGVFNTDLAAAKWVVLVDLSALGVGLNATAEGTIASAGTTNIGGQVPSRLNVTGAATITSFGVVANTYKILRFAAGITLTNNANIILLNANILTEANDTAFFSSDSTGVWRCYYYTRASGVPIGQPDASTTVKGIAELATQAEVDAEVDALRIVTPATLGVRLAALSTSILLNIRAGVGATLDTLAEIATAIGLLAPKAGPTFTGVATFDQIAATGNATGVTPAAGDDDTSFATTAFVNNASMWTRQVLLSGSGTYNTPAGCKKLYIQMVGPGGGGGAAQTNNGANGGTTTFNGIAAAGGLGGGASNGTPGAGGTGGAGSAGIRIAGGEGSNNHISGGGSLDQGGVGGNSFFGGGGHYATAGKANSGGGGGGGATSNSSGAGGGAGEYVDLIIDNPAATYAYAVGAGGNGGAAGTQAGGNGGSGIIIVWEYYFVP